MVQDTNEKYPNGTRYKIEYPSDESYATSDCILSITGGVFFVETNNIDSVHYGHKILFLQLFVGRRSFFSMNIYLVLTLFSRVADILGCR